MLSLVPSTDLLGTIEAHTNNNVSTNECQLSKECGWRLMVRRTMAARGKAPGSHALDKARTFVSLPQVLPLSLLLPPSLPSLHPFLALLLALSAFNSKESAKMFSTKLA